MRVGIKTSSEPPLPRLRILKVASSPTSFPHSRRSVTVAFLAPGFAQLWRAFDMRDERSNQFVGAVTRNGSLWAAAAPIGALFPMTRAILIVADSQGQALR